MFREAKVLAPKSAAGFKLRFAGARACVLRHKADQLPQGVGWGREVPLLPFLPASSTKLHLCQGIIYSSLGPDTAGKSCTGISTGTRVTFCIDRAEGQLLSSHFLVSLAQPSSGEHRIAQKSEEPCREWLEQGSQRRAPCVVGWLWASQLTSLTLHFLREKGAR